jgi:hypothetical protein
VTSAFVFRRRSRTCKETCEADPARRLVRWPVKTCLASPPHEAHYSVTLAALSHPREPAGVHGLAGASGKSYELDVAALLGESTRVETKSKKSSAKARRGIPGKRVLEILHGVGYPGGKSQPQRAPATGPARVQEGSKLPADRSTSPDRSPRGTCGSAPVRILVGAGTTCRVTCSPVSSGTPRSEPL